MARELVSWERKGPLADAPRSNTERRPYEMGDRRPPRDMPADDGKTRDFGNWERKGPLSPVSPPEGAEGSRDSSRPRMGGNDSSQRDRKASPATWGEGRQEGQRPAREFRAERPERPERPERAPTAADLDNKWRNNMKPDAPVKSPVDSREGSEAPTSPRPAAAAAGGRPRLNLAKRTVSEAPDAASTPGAGDSKASPFGAARPIDTAAKEREIEEKRVQALNEKKAADEKAKEEKRLAKEAADKAAAEKAAADAAEAEKAEKAAAEAAAEAEAKGAAAAAEETKEEPKETAPQNGEQTQQKVPVRTRDAPQPKPNRPSDTGNWRSSSGEQRSGGRGYQNAPRGARGDTRGRGGAPRGPRNSDGPRGPGRANGTASPAQTPTSPAAAPEAQPTESDGWTTVSKGGRRGTGARA